MSLNLDFNKFEFILFPGKNPPSYLKNIYLRSYEFWSHTWKKSYQFFGWDPKSVHSDQWTRQDQIGVLLYGNNIIGTLFFDEKDLSTTLAQNDSYFRMWPELSFKKIQNIEGAQNALICSYFTLGEEWRKESQGLNAKYLLCSMATEHLTTTDYKFMVGTVVRKSNIHTMAYDLTAEKIEENVYEKELAVDLIVWHKSRLIDFNYPKEHELIKHIWNKRNVSSIAA
ncbi:MAG: hypothetical protein H6625_03425 [Bdellovibrionaceae bacterium]|nr:hypothetical protein [Pseudobdellovibrionaceae bacterium]